MKRRKFIQHSATLAALGWVEPLLAAGAKPDFPKGKAQALDQKESRSITVDINGQVFLDSVPVTLESLAGNVVVVHFYAFGCINCIHNYPTYLEWHEKYRGKNVVILGIHTPETTAERDSAAVKTRAEDAGFRFIGRRLKWNEPLSVRAAGGPG